jgi:hypothetical protein
MSNSKLVKFLNNTKEPPTTEKKFTPVIFSDSKGNYLQNHVRSSHPVERESLLEILVNDYLLYHLVPSLLYLI